MRPVRIPRDAREERAPRDEVLFFSRRLPYVCGPVQKILNDAAQQIEFTSRHRQRFRAGGCLVSGTGNVWRSERLDLIRRQKHPRRAFDHLRDALRRRRRRGLKNKRQKQRRLTHLHELRRRELAIVDRKILCLDMRLEIEGKAADE